MEAKIRKAQLRMAHSNLLEWQPRDSEKWYSINRKNVSIQTGHAGKSHYDIVRKFFNQLLDGDVVKAKHCQYFKRDHLLLVDLTDLPDLTGGEEMGEKKEEKAEEKEKPEPEKTEKPKAEKPKAKAVKKPKAPTDDDVLAALKQIGEPTGSREVSDKLGIEDPDRGRAYVRRAMKRLAEDSKVEITRKGRQYQYQAA